ncbi:hypothetical protein F5X99DRAFT_408624 [Biscogniauxia marginata]|nr:hypothetical protein F5X99DRAFT_408624 [Biscogniauxia marginata]
MKFPSASSGSSTLLLLLPALAGVVTAAAVDKSLPAARRQDVAWSFSVYQSRERCTGARDPYSGTGSQGCTQGIRNGSFGSYTRGDIRDGCAVYLYNNDDCDTGGIIDVLTSTTPEGCLQPDVEVIDVPSFDVVCE